MGESNPRLQVENLLSLPLDERANLQSRRLVGESNPYRQVDNLTS